MIHQITIYSLYIKEIVIEILKQKELVCKVNKIKKANEETFLLMNRSFKIRQKIYQKTSVD